ncbi:MAG TPA: hypothetical protein VKU36_01610 [Candidatus Babeliales bacterium]|nr:hypothetical protein [Candidatus Babeliales bacterium]
MKKIKLFLLSFLFIPHSFSMFHKHIFNKIRIAKNKSFHTTTSTLKTMNWEEIIEIEKRLHEESLLKNPEFLQKVAHKQENNSELLLKKIITLNEAILTQNHIIFLHHINDRIPINYTAREDMIQKTKDDLTNLYKDHNIDIADSKDKNE